METENGGLERLCKVYKSLNDEEKRRLIRLAEVLLEEKDNSDIENELKEEMVDLN